MSLKNKIGSESVKKASLRNSCCLGSNTSPRTDPTTDWDEPDEDHSVSFSPDCFTKLAIPVKRRGDVSKISTGIGQMQAGRVNAHRKSRRADARPFRGASAIIRRLGVTLSAERQADARLFSRPGPSPGMVIRHATGSTRDALIPLFFWRLSALTSQAGA